MKVLITRPQGAGGAQGIEKLQQAFPAAEFLTASTPEEARSLIGDVDAVIGQVSQDDVLAAERLRWVHSASVGADWVATVPALVERDIVVTNPRGAPNATMAEHAFAMLLTLTRRMREADRFRQQRLWKMQNQPDVSALAGLTMGVIGLGAIGTAVARRAYGFEMEVLAIDVRVSLDLPFVSAVWSPDRLSEFMRRIDVLAITAPLTAQTRGMVGAAELALLKPSAYVVVISRGGIVVESALADALKERRIAGACLDVFEREPLPQESGLWDCDNVIITAHCSGRSRLTDENRSRIIMDNVGRFLTGQPLVNVVNKAAMYF